MNINLGGLLLGWATRDGTVVTYHRNTYVDLIKTSLTRIKNGDTTNTVFQLGTALRAMISTSATELQTDTKSYYIYQPALLDYEANRKSKGAVQILNQTNDWTSGNTYRGFDKLAEDVKFLEEYAATKECDIWGRTDVPAKEKVVAVTTLTISYKHDSRWMVYALGDSSTGFLILLDEQGNLTNEYTCRMTSCPEHKDITIDINGNYATGLIDYINESIQETSDRIVAEVSKQFIQR